MHSDEEQAFQNAQKESDLEIIDYRFAKGSPIHKITSRRTTSEHVPLKFTALSIPSPPNHKHRPISNISFQAEHYSHGSENEESDEDDCCQSNFSQYYQKSEAVYKKKMGFGTNWIGGRQYFASVFVNPSRFEKENLKYFVPCSPFTDDCLIPQSCTFDSDFQSGNLFCAFKVSPSEFDLLLQNDINTKGNTQWFFFRVRGLPKGRPLTVNIINLRKSDSLFNYGLLPCIYSFQQHRRNKRGWFRSGTKVRYFRNEHQIENSKRFYYTLSFVIETRFEGDTLLVAHSYPYGVSDLNHYLENLQAVKYKQQWLERETVCQTVGGNKVEAIKITEVSSKKKVKPLIFVMARQHPGQTPGSFVCEGLINFLLSKEKESDYLRKNYETVVIPMVNPDGVVAGNYRTNLCGYDLNRRWNGGQKRSNLHEASMIKKYIHQMAKRRSVAFILDLHGHSRKMFSFFYGNPSSGSLIQSRIYPYLCCKLGPNLIRFEDSTFLVEDSKRNTARVQLSLTFPTPNIYTYQVSFFGYYGRSKQPEHFTVEGMKQLGEILAKSLYHHERGKQLIDKSADHKEANLYKKCLQELRGSTALISLGEQLNSGSQSSPEECELKEKEEQRLQDDSNYLCSKSTSKVKVMKKILKKEPQVRQMAKTSRQMQVLDIAQVYSAFPSNIIALIPNSYLSRLKKNPPSQAAVQTEDFPLIKIYESCKQQELGFNPEGVGVNQQIDENCLIKTSNLIRSTILSRPRTTNLQYQNSDFVPMSLKSNRKHRDYKRQHSSSAKHSSQTTSKRKKYEKATQTTITFGKSLRNNFQDHFKTQNTSNSKTPFLLGHHNQDHQQQNLLNSISTSKVKISQQSEILAYKSLEPSYATMEPRGLSDIGKIGKAVAKSLLQSLRSRRKNC